MCESSSCQNAIPKVENNVSIANTILSLSPWCVCVCVCVCEEREREREMEGWRESVYVCLLKSLQ